MVAPLVVIGSTLKIASALYDLYQHRKLIEKGAQGLASAVQTAVDAMKSNEPLKLTPVQKLGIKSEFLLGSLLDKEKRQNALPSKARLNTQNKELQNKITTITDDKRRAILESSYKELSTRETGYLNNRQKWAELSQAAIKTRDEYVQKIQQEEKAGKNPEEALKTASPMISTQISSLSSGLSKQVEDAQALQKTREKLSAEVGVKVSKGAKMGGPS